MAKRYRLRPYQKTAIEMMVRLAAGPRCRVAFVAPTGSGKTVIAAEAIRQMIADGKRVMFLAHIVTIVQQTYDQLVELGLHESQVGVMMAGDRLLEGGKDRVRPDAPVQVCGVQTLASMRRRGEEPPHFDVIFVDECHHAAAESYTALMELYPAAWIFGLTATPMRGDGAGLRDSFDDLHIVASVGELIAHDWLAQPVVFGAPVEARELARERVEQVKTSKGDYAPAALSMAMNHRVLVGNVVSEWLRLAKGRQTVVFCCSVAHSEALAGRFREAGIKAVHIDGDNPKQAAAAREWLDRGEITVICNYGVLGEGWDQPSVKCLVQARPTKSLTVHLQQTGRCLRPYRGLRPIILDHAGNSWEHGLAEHERDYTLDGITRHPGQGAFVKECPSCEALIATGFAICPECAHEFPERSSVPEELNVKLEELSAVVREIAKRNALGEVWVRRVLTVASAGGTAS